VPFSIAKTASSYSEGAVWSFTTVGAPKFQSSSPTDEAVGVDPSVTLSVSFDQSIEAAGGLAGITLINTDNSQSVSISPAITGSNTVTINPSALNYNTNYKLSIPASLLNVPGSPSLSNDLVEITFMTSVELFLLTNYPATDASGVDVTSSVYLVFNQSISELKFDNGNVALLDMTNPSEPVPIEQSVTISNDTLFLNHSGLSDSTQYWVYVGKDAVSVSGQPSFTNNLINWYFTTHGTGIESSLADNISIYPNPVFDDKLTVRSSVLGMNYQLVDLLGNVVGNGKITENVTTISLSGKSNGIYILQLVKGNEVVSYRIIKN
jgi:hypothetical protein